MWTGLGLRIQTIVEESIRALGEPFRTFMAYGTSAFALIMNTPTRSKTGHP